MTLQPHEKKRMLLTGGVLFPFLLIVEYFGMNSIWVTGAMAGILGGLGVILFPDPNRK